MSTHVHVRLNRDMTVTEGGELLVLSHCRCGATWTTSYRAEEGEAER
ncbi:hypothetical protein [Streptosporangium sp. NPDC049304]